MKIGFDAKRAFYNTSGLGNYCRGTVNQLLQYYPENEYVLYTPSLKNSIHFKGKDKAGIITPQSFPDRLFPSIWRSGRMSKRLQSDKINVFHGLSNELPNGIHKTGIPSIVTIHDLIVFRHPGFYRFFDRKIYTAKFRYCSKVADKIIAISEQTKKDIIRILNVDEEKISVVYQGCDPAYYQVAGNETKTKIKEKYNLPGQYILMVGTIEERKNLLGVIKAMHLNKIDMPLIVIGKPTPYLDTVKAYIASHHIKQVYFYHNVPNNDLPALYQMATVFVYPSQFEGFGIPVLEALASATPVITSKNGCFSEVGGKTSLYVDPNEPDDIGVALQKVLTDEALQETMKKEGLKHAKLFSEEEVARNTMDVYKEVIKLKV